ncbi:unnamed protein product, partial [Iphiclides podalirius]
MGPRRDLNGGPSFRGARGNVVGWCDAHIGEVVGHSAGACSGTVEGCCVRGSVARRGIRVGHAASGASGRENGGLT